MLGHVEPMKAWARVCSTNTSEFSLVGTQTEEEEESEESISNALDVDVPISEAEENIPPPPSFLSCVANPATPAALRAGLARLHSMVQGCGRAAE